VKKVTDFFAWNEIISTFATLLTEYNKNDTEFYIYSTVWYYYSTRKVWWKWVLCVNIC